MKRMVLDRRGPDCGGPDRRGRLSARWTAFGIASLLLLGCSWDRFEQLKDSPPIEVLRSSSSTADDYGATLSVVDLGDQTSLLVGRAPGSSGASVYRLGQSESPELDPFDGAYCREDSTRKCALADPPAGLPVAPLGMMNASCFVAGPGIKNNSSGLFARCEDGTEFFFTVPQDIEDGVISPLRAGRAVPRVTLAASREQQPVLAVGVGGLNRAFYYEQDSLSPVDLPPQTTAKDFGASAAVAQIGGGWLMAIAAPEAGLVELYSTDGSGPVSLGCLEDEAGFGESLAAGDLDGDGEEDLAVANSGSVEVYSGAELLGLVPSGGGCALSAPQADLRLARVSCQQDADLSGCGGSDFGASLQIDDFNGDSQGELAVGAPQFSVRGIKGAGAVQVFDLAGQLIELLYPSDPQTDGQFGSALVSVPQQGRAVLVVGEPGAKTANITYCVGVAGTGISPRCL